jgi:hypothetical protein
MQYVLVENKERVLLGPSPWRVNFFQSELDDLGIDYDLPKVAPVGLLQINENAAIYEVHSLVEPSYNPLYEHLGGPFWAFETGQAKGWYNVREHNIELVRSNLKGIAAAERYRKEVSGTSLSINGIAHNLDTSREGRALLAQKLLGMPEDSLVQWKHNSGWVQISKTDVQEFIIAIDSHIQDAFNWEKAVNDEIEAATSIESLKAIEIIEERNVFLREP